MGGVARCAVFFNICSTPLGSIHRRVRRNCALVRSGFLDHEEIADGCDAFEDLCPGRHCRPWMAEFLADLHEGCFRPCRRDRGKDRGVGDPRLQVGDLIGVVALSLVISRG